jgi:hypothetical protein
MATYTAVITVNIEADDDQEAYSKYLDCDWDIDGHELYKYDENWEQVLVNEDDLEYTQ